MENITPFTETNVNIECHSAEINTAISKWNSSTDCTEVESIFDNFLWSCDRRERSNCWRAAVNSLVILLINQLRCELQNLGMALM